MLVIKAFASGRSNRPGNGTTVRDSSEQRRGNESMSAYYRRTGQSALGATPRTRGTLAPIRPAQRGR